jgi:hypothetical protein
MIITQLFDIFRAQTNISLIDDNGYLHIVLGEKRHAFSTNLLMAVSPMNLWFVNTRMYTTGDY